MSVMLVMYTGLLPMQDGSALTIGVDSGEALEAGGDVRDEGRQADVIESFELPDQHPVRRHRDS